MSEYLNGAAAAVMAKITEDYHRYVAGLTGAIVSVREANGRWAVHLDYGGPDGKFTYGGATLAEATERALEGGR